MSNPEPQKQLCTLRIVFPVESDEKAIYFKQKVTAALVEIEDAQITFGLINAPSAPPCKV